MSTFIDIMINSCLVLVGLTALSVIMVFLGKLLSDQALEAHNLQNTNEQETL